MGKPLTYLEINPGTQKIPGREEYGNEVIHSVQRAAITGIVNIPEGESLLSFHEKLQGVVHDVCTVLSLCYRQPVNYYEIEYATDPNATPREDRRRGKFRRRHNELRSRIREDELIHLRNLINGGADRLFQSFVGSDRKGEISRAIRYLASSYKMVTLESSYFLVYSALDLIASTNNQANPCLFNLDKWNRVQGSLVEHLNSITVSEELEPILAYLKQRLPQLNNPPGDRRIVEACRALNVKTDDLWSGGRFEIGLRSATRIRNRLFHAASSDDIDEMYDNLIRIRTLVERLLLKILGWPDDELWVSADDTLRRING